MGAKGGRFIWAGAPPPPGNRLWKQRLARHPGCLPLQILNTVETPAIIVAIHRINARNNGAVRFALKRDPTMKSFAALYAQAAKRKGGTKVLEALLPTPLSKAKLAKISDDRWLSMMSKRVFQAGFNWRMVEKKWPDIEEAFAGFHPQRWKFMSDDDLDWLLRDKRIIRHATKILAVRDNATFLCDNATFLCDLAEEHGSAARFFADWPAEDYAGLLLLLKKRAARLGGNSGQYFLRFMGKDSFILSRDVVAALLREGVVSTEPKSQRDLKRVQEAFNHWHQESGRSLTQISKVLAYTVGV